MHWQTVAKFLDLTEADIARSSLDAAGLSVRLRDEQLGGLDWGYIPALGGLRLEVPEEQAEEALAILGDFADAGAVAPEETEHLVNARRRKRNVGIVALLLMLGPIALLVLMFSAINRGARRS